jgi:predicted ATPase
MGVERPFVDRVRIEKFRCIKSLDLRLTPLHALIGPNDSGKSSILAAIKHQWFNMTHPRVERVEILRLDPDHLREPQPLIAKGQPLWFGSERGHGLASLYDALLTRDRDSFIKIDHQFRSLFPTVKALRLENVSSSTKAMGMTLSDGTEVGPSEMSEGMLYWLAFAILEHIAPGGILMIEEPENGLHPARIAEVMRVLRDVSTRTQVLIATHSPLVVNELQPDEVTLVTRRSVEEGTKAMLMSETKNFAERAKTYALGELWLAYADGDHEKELVAPPSFASKAG